MLSRYQNCIHYLKIYKKSPARYIGLLEKAPYFLNRAIHASSSRTNGTSGVCCPPCPPQPKTDPCGSGSGSKGSGGRVTYKKYIPPPKEDHDAKNMRIGRPMSPHLTIFGPTLPAVTSILERITGAILTFYAVVLAGGALFLPNGIETYVWMIQSLDLSSTSVFIVKLFMGAPFPFHYFIGMRFVGWNAGKYYTLKESYVSAKYAIIAASVLNVFFALR